MKMYCITANMDTAVGLKLTVIDTVVVQKKEEIEIEIDKALEDKNIGILIVTDKIYEISKEKLNQIRNKFKIPLLVKL